MFKFYYEIGYLYYQKIIINNLIFYKLVYKYIQFKTYTHSFQKFKFKFQRISKVIYIYIYIYITLDILWIETYYSNE